VGDGRRPPTQNLDCSWFALYRLQLGDAWFKTAVFSVKTWARGADREQVVTIATAALGLAASAGSRPPLASVIMKLIRASAVSRIHCRLSRARRDSGGDLPKKCHGVPSAATFST